MCWTDHSVELLIGLNAPAAFWHLESVRGSIGEPFAVRTIFGWTIQGPIQCPEAQEAALGMSVSKGNTRVTVEDLSAYFEKLYHADFSGLHDFESRGQSQDDKLWLDKVQTSISKTQSLDGSKHQYVISLPFRDGMDKALHDNRLQAIRRLRSLEAQFHKNQQFKHDYQEFMQKMLRNGFMEKVENPEVALGPVSYVLHHGVYHPHKPGKIRVVFNCASKFKGVSLNDCLLSGPDLTSSLLGVLIRFRQDAVAFMADIDSMFYNVLVPEEQRDVLRLLWQEGSDIATYRLRVHLFGATSLPSIANYALRRAADDAVTDGIVPVEVGQAIKSNFYVDDCLRSVPTTGEAIALAHGIAKACRHGGFNLSKFVSNSIELLKSFEAQDLSKDLIDINLESADAISTLQERALGIRWSIKDDVFQFKIKELLLEPAITRRQILSRLSSLYDPLGMAAPVIIVARIIFRELTRNQNSSWDEQINTEDVYGKRWKDWECSLPSLQEVRVPRCFQGSSREGLNRFELHTFCDASKEACVAVIYLRCMHTCQVSFVLGKARVAPPKAGTIPRLELIAAKMGTEMATTVQRELQFDIVSRTFWSDSETVLKYLNNKSRRFHTFVANRVNSILSASTADEWRHVPTGLNPADEATRGLQASQLTGCLWLTGPEFLKLQDDKWPLRIQVTGIEDSDPEMKREQVLAVSADAESSFIEDLVARCSTAQRVRKLVAVWLRLKAYLRSKPQHGPTAGHFSWPELRGAENAIISWLQRETWPELFQGHDQSQCNVPKRSPLYKLSPVRQEDTIYMESRVQKKMLPIIPKCRFAKLLVDEAHRQQLHFGRQATSTRILQHYRILGLNALVRSVIRACCHCQKRKTPPMQTRMAPLPNFRTMPSTKPFETTGVDYFGPFMLATMSETEKGKAYGVLFTCATTRAVHLEVAENLTKSAFLNALRRFVARRGSVSTLVSDNGTNFTGANAELAKELRKAITKHQKDEEIRATIRSKRIEWVFNAPAASHHGGFWERLIRSIRQALQCLINSFTPLSLNSLYTLFCECEAVLNNRPITVVSEDSDDLEPLTPNHLLIGYGSPPETNTSLPGDFRRVSLVLRHQWKRVQHLANVFWRRWLREYRTLLQLRSKWHRKEQDLQLGDIVLVVDSARPRQYWKLGKVQIIHCSKRDGAVRSAEVKTSHGIVSRPITKLCKLEGPSASPQ